MSDDVVIPRKTLLAAKRGFLRTTAQAYAASLATGISAAVVQTVVSGGPELLPLVVTGVAAVASPPLAGAASFLSILARGIPDDYVPAAIDQAPAALLRRDLRDRGDG